MDELQTHTVTITRDEAALIDQLGFDTVGDFVRDLIERAAQLLDD